MFRRYGSPLNQVSLPRLTNRRRDGRDGFLIFKKSKITDWNTGNALPMPVVSETIDREALTRNRIQWLAEFFRRF